MSGCVHNLLPAMPVAQGLNYICTFNNFNGVARELLKQYSELAGVRGVCGQSELSASGTPHLQFVVRFTRAKSCAAVRTLLPRVHVEIVRGGIKKAQEYCTKADTRRDGPWFFGDCCDNRNHGCSNDDIVAASEVFAREGGAEAARQYPVVYIKHGRGLRDHALRIQPPQQRGTLRSLRSAFDTCDRRATNPKD